MRREARMPELLLVVSVVAIVLWTIHNIEKRSNMHGNWIDRAAERIARHNSAESVTKEEIEAIAAIIRDCYKDAEY